MTATHEDKQRAIEEQLAAEVKHYREMGKPKDPDKIRRELVALQENLDRRGRK